MLKTRQITFYLKNKTWRWSSSAHGLKLHYFNFMQAVSYFISRYIINILFDFEVRGQEYLEGLKGKPLIFASNHASYSDGFICGSAIPCYEGEIYPSSFLPISYLVNDKYFNIKYLISAIYLRMIGAIAIYRSGGHLELSLRSAIRAIENGKRVWIYPEGKLNTTNILQKGRRGVAYLHHRTGVPIIPVAIMGSRGLLSLNSLQKKKKVRVLFGMPIYRLNHESLFNGADFVMHEIRKLMESGE